MNEAQKSIFLQRCIVKIIHTGLGVCALIHTITAELMQAYIKSGTKI